ncbi:MAG: hypothetical protein JRG91_12335 [Deltaproteobacteria bacterium]|nr:hypothetical protein [Deltaproteobacteria bacterium]
MKPSLIGLSLLLVIALGCGSKSKNQEDGEDTSTDPVDDGTGGDAADVPGDATTDVPDDVTTDVPDEEVVETSALVVEVTTPGSPQYGEVTIEYLLLDDRVPPINGDMTVEYSLDGSSFAAATEVAGGEGVTDLTSAAGGASHTFVWDTMTDLGMGLHDVVVLITPLDTGTTLLGTADQTETFRVVNAEFAAGVTARVFDPEMGGSPSTDVQYRADPAGIDFVITVSVARVDTGAEVRRLVDGTAQAGGTDHVASWDGTDDSGVVVDTGEYEVTVEAVYETLPVLTGTDGVHVVRLGVVEVEYVSNGTAGEEYQMMYHIRNTSKYTYYAIPDDRPQWAMGPENGELEDMDTDDGAARPLPAVWTTLNSPPQDSVDPAGVEDDNYNLPVCYRRGSVPRLSVSLGTGAVSNTSPGTPIVAGYPLTGMPIRLLVAGADPVTAGTNEDVSPGVTVDFIPTTALPDAVQKHAVSNTFSFEYEDGGSWVAVPGSITTDHTIYTIYDDPTLIDSGTPVAPYLPWVRLVDLVTTWVDGPATAEDVCGTVIARTNDYFGLEYDIASGATHYASGGLSAHVMQMSDFIEDWDAGTFTVVNCSDCAVISTTFANTVGVDHLYQILGLYNRINLNYQIPIGRWWMVPFSGSFRYHAVSTYDSGTTTSDATCTLDDDSDPRSSPHTAILPVNMPYATYKAKLSWNPTGWGSVLLNRCGQR